MKKILKALAILLIANISACLSAHKYHTTNSMAEIRDHILAYIQENPTKKVFVFFDLDETVTVSDDPEGRFSSDWYMDQIAEDVKKGIAWEEAANKWTVTASLHHKTLQVRAVEPCIINFISTLQKSGVSVMGLTMRSKGLAPSSFANLEQVGVDFKATAPQTCDTGLRYAHYENGVHFCSQQHPKYVVIEASLAQCEKLPDIVFMIDDRLNHIRPACQNFGSKTPKFASICFVGFHYTSYSEQYQRMRQRNDLCCLTT